MTDTTFAYIAVLTVDTPAGAGTAWPAMTHIAAISLLIAERAPDETWSFALRHRAVGAGDGEFLLLAWATSAMPEQGVSSAGNSPTPWSHRCSARCVRAIPTPQPHS